MAEGTPEVAPKIRKVLIAVDSSEESKYALDWALENVVKPDTGALSQPARFFGFSPLLRLQLSSVRTYVSAEPSPCDSPPACLPVFLTPFRDNASPALF